MLDTEVPSGLASVRRGSSLGAELCVQIEFVTSPLFCQSTLSIPPPIVVQAKTKEHDIIISCANMNSLLSEFAIAEEVLWREPYFGLSQEQRS